MKKLLHLNAHHPYSFSEGSLNAALTEHAIAFATEKGYDVRQTASAENYNVEVQLEENQWADLIMLQTPVNWMGVPWSFKKYMDEVYSAGTGISARTIFSMYSCALFELSAPGPDATIAIVMVLFPEATLPLCPASKNLPV